MYEMWRINYRALKPFPNPIATVQEINDGEPTARLSDLPSNLKYFFYRMEALIRLSLEWIQCPVFSSTLFFT